MKQESEASNDRVSQGGRESWLVQSRFLTYFRDAEIDKSERHARRGQFESESG